MRNHGEIWLVNLNPGRGTESGKISPVTAIAEARIKVAEAAIEVEAMILGTKKIED